MLLVSTFAHACNYESDATQNDGSCDYITLTCFNDENGDGYYDKNQQYDTCASSNPSCSDLGSTWVDQVSPHPPAMPEVQAVTGNEQVLLMWDTASENSIDGYSGYSDFEGYRIYRSTDGGITWGDFSDRIFDYSGNIFEVENLVGK